MRGHGLLHSTEGGIRGLPGAPPPGTAGSGTLTGSPSPSAANQGLKPERPWAGPPSPSSLCTKAPL